MCDAHDAFLMLVRACVAAARIASNRGRPYSQNSTNKPIAPSIASHCQMSRENGDSDREGSPRLTVDGGVLAGLKSE